MAAASFKLHSDLSASAKRENWFSFGRVVVCTTTNQQPQHSWNAEIYYRCYSSTLLLLPFKIRSLLARLRNLFAEQFSLFLCLMLTLPNRGLLLSAAALIFALFHVLSFWVKLRNNKESSPQDRKSSRILMMGHNIKKWLRCSLWRARRALSQFDDGKDRLGWLNLEQNDYSMNLRSGIVKNIAETQKTWKMEIVKPLRHRCRAKQYTEWDNYPLVPFFHLVTLSCMIAALK